MTVKLGRFYEQPLVYVSLVFFSIFIYLTFDRLAGTVLSLLSLAAWVLFLTTKPILRINSVKGNTLLAIGIGAMALGISLGLSILTGMFVFGFDTGSIAEFITHNKAAILGSQTLPFSGNPLLVFLVFIVAFPVVETVVILQLFDLILRRFKGTLSLRDWKSWAVAAMMGIGAVFYHVYAKSTTIGSPNPNALMIIFWIFFVECMIAAYTREKESSIYHHILNNALALL